MAISSQTSSISYTGNASVSTPYAIPFRYDDSAWVVVEEIDSAGTVTTLALATDYTLTGDGTATTGNVVTSGGAIPATSTLRISRDTERTQTFGLTANGQIPSASIGRAFDKTTMALQDARRKLALAEARALRGPDSESFFALPAAASRLGKLLRFNPTTGAPELVTAAEVAAQADEETAALIEPVVFRIQTYGALGDGVTNDAPAIRAAFTAALASAADHVEIYFGAGLWLLGTDVAAFNSVNASVYIAGSLRKKRITVNLGGGYVFSTRSTATNLFAVHCPFDEFIVMDGKIERTSGTDIADAGLGQQNYAEGFAFYQYDNTEVRKIEFRDVRIDNCHRAASFYRKDTTNGAGYRLKDIRGLCQEVRISRCNFDYPYGANHDKGGGGASGGQVLYFTEWIRHAIVESCYCDGHTLGDGVAVPGSGFPKDGFIYSAALCLTVRGCTIKHHSVEAIVANVQRGLSYSTANFTMPAIGATVTITDATLAAEVEVGDIVMRQAVGGFEVTAVSGIDVTLENLGTISDYTNVAGATAVTADGFFWDNYDAKDCYLIAEDNLALDSYVANIGAGINVNACDGLVVSYGLNVIASGNKGLGIKKGIFATFYDYHLGKGEKSVISDNYLELIDQALVSAGGDCVGIDVNYMHGGTISDNEIVARTGYDCRGIGSYYTRGVQRVVGNVVRCITPYLSGGLDDSVAYTFAALEDGGDVLGSIQAEQNSDEGFVTGISDANTGRSDYGYVRDHTSTSTRYPNGRTPNITNLDLRDQRRVWNPGASGWFPILDIARSGVRSGEITVQSPNSCGKIAYAIGDGGTPALNLLSWHSTVTPTITSIAISGRRLLMKAAAAAAVELTIEGPRGHGVCPADMDTALVAITAISVAASAVVTSAAHGMTTGAYVLILDSDCTPSIDGVHQITVTGTDTFTIPVTTSGSGSAGSLLRNYPAADSSGLVKLATSGAYSAPGFRTSGTLRAARLSLTNDTNGSMGTATLVAGVATVTTTMAGANTVVLLQRQTDGGTIGASYSVTRSAGVSFTITARKGDGTAETADTSVIGWTLIEPNL